MARSGTDNELSMLADLVARRLGLHYPVERRRDLERGATAAAAEFGFRDLPAYARWLAGPAAGTADLEGLASHLTIGETYFFREHRHFELLATEILPPLIRERESLGGGNRRLRIWSAACCTGEEPYSIAILLRRLIPAIDDWNITLLATDVNARFLEKAQAGIYGEWSFRDAPEWLKSQSFRQRPHGRYEVLPEIRRMVSLARLNLAEDGYPTLSNNTHAMDLIFCRNVLMYFTAEQAREAIGKLYRAQVQGGWLLVGSSELLHVNSSPYRTVKGRGAIVYRKERPGKRPEAMPEEKAGASGGAPGGAIATVRPAIQKYNPSVGVPAPRENVLEIAAALYEQGRYGDAVEKLGGGAAGALGRRPEPLRLLARCQANQGRLEEALKSCDAWLALDKMDAAGHYVRAMILQESHRNEEAAAALRRTVYLDHDFVMAHFAMGMLAHSQGHEAEARRHFTNVRRLLSHHGPGDALRESEGMTAGRLLGLMESSQGAGRTP